MTTKTLHSAHTPSQRTAADLEQLFVVREPIADSIIKTVKASVLTANKHNNLLIGPRGIGKTHLISIINNRLAADESLSGKLKIAWLPEDSYVASYNALLAQIIQTLCQTYHDYSLDDKYEKMLDLEGNNQQRDFAEQVILEYLNSCALLIIAENLDDLMANIGKDGQHHLRALMQNNPVFSVLGAATSLSEATQDKDAPFYGFFNIRQLTPFSVDDAVAMLTKLAENEDKEALADKLNSPMGRARIQALHYLAGGNPRVYTVFFDCLTCEALDDLVGPFIGLLDEMTPYYQSHMKSLPPLQRNIIDILRKKRGVATVKEIARRAMRTQPAISKQLGELEKLRFVELAYSKGRYNYYELREPLMRLCLEVKEQRGGNVELFIEFLRIWHSPKELDDLYAANASNCSTYWQEAMLRAKEQADPLKAIFEQQTADFLDPNDAEQTLENIEAALLRDPDDVEQWCRKALCLRADNRSIVEQITCWAEITKRVPKSAEPWHIQATLLGNINEFEQAKQVYNRAIAIQTDNADLHLGLSHVLTQLNQHQQAKKEFDIGIKLQGPPTTASEWLYRALHLFENKKVKESIQALFEALLLDYKNISASGLLLNALQQQGWLLACHKLSQWAISIMPDEAQLYQFCAIALADIGDESAAIFAFENAIRLFDQNNEIANARTNKEKITTLLFYAHALNQIGQHNQALKLLNNEAVQQCKIQKLCLWRDSEYANTMLCLDQWQNGTIKLKNTLTKHMLSHYEPADFLLLSQLLKRTQNPIQWQRYIKTYIDIFTKINQLPFLGQVLIRTLHNFNHPLVTNEVATNWYKTWYDICASIPEFALPLRLLEAAAEYKNTKDELALMKLPREERGLLEPWFLNLLNQETRGETINNEIDELIKKLNKPHSEASKK